MSSLTTLLGIATIATALPLASAAADSIFSSDDLVGTIWVSKAPYSWSRIDADGNVGVFESDGHVFQILEHNGGVFAIKIHWWNIENSLSVVEFGVMVESRDNSYLYDEAGHSEDSGFPGIQGEGFFRIVDENNAQVFQLGDLGDGAAGAFSIDLEKVDHAPEIPVPVTHPAPQ